MIIGDFAQAIVTKTTTKKIKLMKISVLKIVSYFYPIVACQKSHVACGAPLQPNYVFWLEIEKNTCFEVQQNTL